LNDHDNADNLTHYDYKEVGAKPRLLGGEDVKLTVGNMRGCVSKSIIATNLTVEAATSGKQTRYTRIQG
jgi:hypothetical protein